jgi:D-alanine-D-alanine ligase
MTRVAVIYNHEESDDKYRWEGRDVTLETTGDTALGVRVALSAQGIGVSMHPVSSKTEDAIEAFIKGLKASPFDMVFNLCEGAFGKSAFEMHIAAILELQGMPFTGSPALTLGLALNKGLTKDILSSRGVTTPEYCILDGPPQRLKRGLKFPLIIKPLMEDSSLGIDQGAVVKTMKELRKRVDYITSSFNQPAIAEEYIDGREFNVSVLGNLPEAVALPPSEIDFLDFPEDAPKICCYESKWIRQSPFYSKTKPVCPADIPEELARELSSTALRAYGIMGCRDYARVDMRVGEDGNVKVLEVNPNPDISEDAGFARAGRVHGLSYPRLIAEIVRLAEKRYHSKGAHKVKVGAFQGV